MSGESARLPDPESDLGFLVEQLASDSDDSFRYSEIAESLGNALGRATPPFVYGICGPWGSGKSSLLRYLVRYLPSKAEGNIGIHFNAWRATLQSDIRLAFIVSVLDQLGKAMEDLNEGEETSSWKGKSREVLSNVMPLASAAFEALRKGNGLAGFLTEATHVYLKQAEGQTKAVLGSEIEDHSSLVWLGNDIREKGFGCFVLVDELDRCTPNDVVKVIESIRVFFFGSDGLEDEVARRYGRSRDHAQSPFRFIIAIDEEYVVDAFASHYSIEPYRAAMYLDKFIQFKFHFPRKDWDEFVVKFLDKHGDDRWLPSGKGNLPRILSAFDVADPRTAGRALGYLLFWQARLYPNLAGRGVSDVLLRFLCEKPACCADNALTAVNEALLTWAMVKISYPEYADRTVGRRLIETLPTPDEELDLRLKLFDSIDDASIHDRWGNRALELVACLRSVREVIREGIEDSRVSDDHKAEIAAAAGNLLEEVFKN